MNDHAPVGFCQVGEIGKVMRFIRDHWSPRHILALSEQLMHFQHYCPIKKQYNFVIARRTDGELDSILGFIPASKFDSSLASSDTLWLSLWKTRDDASNRSVGLNLLRFLEQSIGHAVIGTLGVSETASAIYRALRFETGTLSHYYLVDPERKHFEIAVNPQQKLQTCNQSQYRLTELSANELPRVTLVASSPSAKTPVYLYSKYGHHPHYKYRFLHCKETNLILVLRDVVVGSARAIRIVDAAGSIETIPNVRSALLKHIRERNAEYADMLISESKGKHLLEADFALLDMQDNEAIVPNYFEPFVRSNSPIRYALKVKYGAVPVLFKGDADQDRPAQIVGVNA